MCEKVSCQQCGTDYYPSEELKGQCPKCLMQRAMFISDVDVQTDDDAQSEAPHVIAPTIDELKPLFPQLEILELIGCGGMGAVYKARQPKLDRLVALKILPREAARDPRFAERFAREARSLASLSHPNIVALHDFGETDSLYYFVMEYVAGTNLREALRCGKFSSGDALEVVPKICDALQYAHEEGIVHRDIKPENILLDQRGRIKIADFGLAKLLTADGERDCLTATRQVVGTPHYMSPEQMERPLEVDHRADIYSLGVVFYEMLTGELPIGRFEPPSQKVKVDVRFDEVVLRALAKEPARRYQRASDVRSCVDTIAQNNPERPTSRPQRFAIRHKVLEWLRDVLSDETRAKELLLAASCWLVLLFGMVNLAVPLLAIASWIMSFVLARCLIGQAKNWSDLSNAQYTVLPPLVAGYLAILSAMLFWPAAAIGTWGSAPETLDVGPSWGFLGYRYEELHHDAVIPRYWLMVAVTAATATMVWCVALSLYSKKYPKPFSLVFHPSDESTIGVVATYVMCVALFTLGPLALTVGCILAFVTG